MRKYFMLFGISTILMTPAFAQNSAVKPIKIKFDSKYEVAGQKFSVKKFAPNLPANWDQYNYLVFEMKASSPQRLQIGFNTPTGYNELRVMPYAVGGWSRVAIPLRLYREKPRPSHDLASYNNIPSAMAWYNLGDAKRAPIGSPDSIGFRMQAPIGDPTLEIRAVSLAAEDPGDAYLEKIPLIDEFGQWNLGDFDGKAKSLASLEDTWAKEEQDLKPGDFGYGKFGGYLNTNAKATGYFRTEKIDGKWWFVDPEGHLFLSVGVDCVRPGGGTTAERVDKREGVYKELPSGSSSVGRSYGNWNLFRRYGDDWLAKSREMQVKRMEAWGLNTIANWSDMGVIKLNEKPFILQLNNLGIDRGILGLPNVYAPGFAKRIDSVVAAQVTPFKENPWLIGWFTGNEPAWLGEEDRLAELILERGDANMKSALQQQLAGGDNLENRKQFAYKTLRIFLETVNNALRKHDPNHLHVGLRFGHSTAPADEILAICKDVYDVYSFNSYALQPSTKYMNDVMRKIDLPMIIGEYHFGTVDRGMAQSLWQVDNQYERGVAYSYYTENAYAHPALIGTAYFQWSDQPNTGRSMDGENYNCGLVDVTDQPYKHQVDAMIKTAKRLKDIHSGKLKPVQETPKRARGYGTIPEGWNKL